MTMTRDEVLSRRFTQPPEVEKRETADRVARDVERFLRTGGRIEQVPIGVSGYQFTGKPKPFKVVSEEQRRRGVAGPAAQRTNGKLSLTAAAKLADSLLPGGMTMAEFRTVVLSGKGPKSFAQGHTSRFEEHVVREWIEQRIKQRIKLETQIVNAMQNLRRRVSA